MMMDIKNKLNKSQYNAVTSDAQYLRIIAGAGTGKTRALTYRIAYLLANRKATSRSLVAITFTNKVAKEMTERVSDLIKGDEYIDRLPLICTYHAFCLRFLRREINYLPNFTKSFSIVDEDDQKSILKKTAEDMFISYKSDKFKALLSVLYGVKCKGLLPEEVEQTDIETSNISINQFVTFYQHYQEYLMKSNSLDFDDILIFTLKILRENKEVKAKYQARYDCFLVDEYQDTNRLQYNLLKEFLSPSARLTVVGDPDQTIYTWRGAEAGLIRKDLSRDFPTLQTVILDENYRSTQTILDVANRLINCNIDREHKNLVAASGLVGTDVDYQIMANQDLEAQYIANKIFEEKIKGEIEFRDIAIIYRSNYLSRAIENALAIKRIPYRIFGGHKFYDRASIKDALAYLKIIFNPSDDASFMRVLKAPSRGMGDVSLSQITSYAIEHDIGYLETVIDHLDELNHLKSGSILRLMEFKKALGEVIVKLSEANFEPDSIKDVIRDYFEKSGFISHIIEIDRKKKEKDPQADLEIDNINEFIRNIHGFFTGEHPEDEFDEEDLSTASSLLSVFLANVMLMSLQDDMDQSNAVSLMTVHVAKGLEFKEVFVTGLVNGVFPNSHAFYAIESEPLEEERRMFYVAITRAQSVLHVTTFQGFSFISKQQNTPSIFLKEAGLVTVYRPITEAYKSPVNRPPTGIKTFNSVNDIKTQMAKLSKHESLADRITNQGSSIIMSGIKTSGNTKKVYKVDDKVLSTSYGIGVVLAVNNDKVTAFFEGKEGEKQVKFLSASLGFRPLDAKTEGGK